MKGKLLPRPRSLRDLMLHYWHVGFLVGFPLLAGWFNLLEKYIVPRHWVSCSFDELIPYIPVFVIPYVVWFPLIAVILTFLGLSDRGDFIRTLLLLYAGMASALVIYSLFPHGQPLRPVAMEDGFFDRMVHLEIYANDTNTNCFPSIHVLNQLAVHIGLCKSKMFRHRRGWKAVSLMATLLICSSTVLIKQHSILDVAASLLLEIPLYLLVFRVDWGRILPHSWMARIEQREQPSNI